MPITQIQGNVNLLDRSELSLGKAHLVGRIQAGSNTQINLMPQATWTLNGNSEVGNLSLDGKSNVVLNSRYHNPNKQGETQFNQLTINGRLAGTGHFHFLTNVAGHIGDKIVVNGVATGAHILSVKNTGKEPSEVDPLSLVKLNNPNQRTAKVQFALENGFVDLGAYRYILANRNNDYRLYNPLRDAELQTNVTAQLIAENQKAFELLQSQLTEKQQEVSVLNDRYQQANNQRVTDHNRLNQLKTTLSNTNAQSENVLAEHNRTSWIRFVKRNQLMKQYNQLQQQLTQQRNQVSTADTQAKHSAQAATQALHLLTQAQNAVNSMSEQQRNLQTESDRLQKGYQQNVALARQRCEAEGLASNICNQVASVVNDSGETLLDAMLSDNIERVEAAQLALTQAQASGQVEAIQAAELALNQEASELFATLDRTYRTLGDIENFLSTQPNAVAMPLQAQLISRYANTALSELSANVNGALQIGRNLDRHLLSQDKSNVWVNTESTKRTYRSDYYRPYKQTMTLTQIGVSQALNDNLQIGAVLSHSRANNDFDENVSGKNRFTAINAFIKGEWQNGLFGSLDMGYGRSRNSVKLDGEESVFHRTMFNASANLGTRWDWGVNVQPSVGVRFYRLSGVNYNLGGANIHNDNLHLTTYRAGIVFDKTFDVNGVQLKPSFATHYYDATQRKLAIDGALSVNEVGMKQQFGRYFNHELGLATSYQQWNVSANAGYLKGSDVAPQKYVAVKLGYSW